MTVRTKIRMAWTFEGCDEGHTRLDVAGNQMRAEGMSREAIARVAAKPDLSNDVREVVTRALAD